jgi:hypothetical protein
MRASRSFRGDIGRNGLVAVYHIRGNQGPLVERFRTAMLEGTG